MSQSVRFVIFLLCSVVSLSAFAAVPDIKVLIGKDLPSISVSGVDLSKKLVLNNLSKVYPGLTNLKFNCDKLSSVIKDKKPILLANLSSETGLINWNNDRYRGELKVSYHKEGKEEGCNLINKVSLEDYISSLLSREMRADWPIEALKAQAIAARTYAYQKMITKQVSKDLGAEAYYDVENSEKHQVTGTFFDETGNTSRATRETKGEILTLKDGKITPVFFHSKCGGETRTPGQVWSKEVPGYVSVKCPFCHNHGKKHWVKKIKKADLAKYFDKTLKNYYEDKLSSLRSTIAVVKDTKSNSKIRFYEGDKLKVIQKSRLSSIMGRSSLPSTLFSMKINKDEVVFEGDGFGHGVGMCQFGAFELAKRGYSYKQILSFYFPNHHIEKIYE